MARGWESKSVESQMEDAAEDRRVAAQAARVSADEIRLRRERESLELSRSRILHDIELTAHPKRREQLSAALAFLDEQLAKLV